MTWGNRADAVDVAAAILEAKPNIDQMQLHKLLYLVEAAMLSWFGQDAFDEAIEAWKYGPVVRRVAGKYMSFNRQPIPKPVDGNSERLDRRLRFAVDWVISRYGDLPGPTLARMVKEPEGPWQQIRGDLPEDAYSDEEIPRDLIASYHKRHGLTTPEISEEEQGLIRRVHEGDEAALSELFGSATSSSSVS